MGIAKAVPSLNEKAEQAEKAGLVQTGFDGTSFWQQIIQVLEERAFAPSADVVSKSSDLKLKPLR